MKTHLKEMRHLFLFACTMLLLIASPNAESQVPDLDGQLIYENLCKLNGEWKQKLVGHLPVHEALAFQSDQQIIRYHLGLVEQELRANTPAGLNQEQLQNRELSLDILAEYRDRGLFPQNSRHSVRTPYFIDDNNTACAVGYLMQGTGASDLADHICDTGNNLYVREMQYPEVLVWAEDNGFLVEELAWIQPTYGPEIIIDIPQPSVQQPTCGNADGALNPTYTYYYADNPGLPVVEQPNENLRNVLDQENVPFVDLKAGLYEFSVSVGFNYRSALQEVNDAGGPAIEAAISAQTCPNEADGAITLSISEGAGPYEVSWYNSSLDLIATGESLAGLDGGVWFYDGFNPDASFNYIAVVEDSEGCKSYKKVLLPLLDNGVYASTFEVVEDATCSGNDGSINPYYYPSEGEVLTYEWSTGDNTPGISGLEPGSYTLVLSNQASCLETYNFVVGSNCSTDCAGPVEELEWFNQFVDTHIEYEIAMRYEWNGETFFVFLPGYYWADVPFVIYSCEGEYICEWGGWIGDTCTNMGDPLSGDIVWTNCNISSDYSPVCGADGMTYDNETMAYCAGNLSWEPGTCPCACTADLLFGPVCGEDGNTYTTACDAYCLDLVYSVGPCGEGSACGVENPLTDLPWLVQMQNFAGLISQYSYQGQDVFLVGDCDEVLDGMQTLFDCEGNDLCFWGGFAGGNGEDCPDFAEEAILVEEFRTCDNTCDFDNPLVDLPWLQAYSGMDGIVQYEYNGETVFVVGECGIPVDGTANMYDCQGNWICQWGGFFPPQIEDCPDFQETGVLVQVVESCFPDQCLFESPWDLDWLVDLSHEHNEIFWYEYQGNTVFMTSDCPIIADGMQVIYDCDGEMICYWGGKAANPGVGCEDFFETAQLVNQLTFCGGFCYIDDPIVDLAWLSDLAQPGMVITQMEHFQHPIFEVANCIEIGTSVRSYYDCEGTLLCTASVNGGVQPEDCALFIGSGLNPVEVIFDGCESDCSFEDPLVDLPWLQDWLGLGIEQYEYYGETVFLVGNCEVGPDFGALLLDCSGNQICSFGGIGGPDTGNCPDFIEVGVLIEVIDHCTPIQTCQFEDPTTDLAWLNNLLSLGDCCAYNRVFQFDTPDGPLFYIDDAFNEPGCNDQPSLLYDCLGNLLCVSEPGNNCYQEYSLGSYPASQIYSCDPSPSSCSISDPLLEAPWIPQVFTDLSIEIPCACAFEVRHICYGDNDYFIFGPGPGNMCGGLQPVYAYDAFGNIAGCVDDATGYDFCNDSANLTTDLGVVMDCSENCVPTTPALVELLTCDGQDTVVLSPYPGGLSYLPSGATIDLIPGEVVWFTGSLGEVAPINCDGTEVAVMHILCMKEAECEEPLPLLNAGCPENYDPVCGCDGVTYGNACEALYNGVGLFESGECPDYACPEDPTNATIEDYPWLEDLAAEQGCCGLKKIFRFTDGIDHWFYTEPGYPGPDCPGTQVPQVYDCDGNLVCSSEYPTNCYSEQELYNMSGYLLWECEEAAICEPVTQADLDWFYEMLTLIDLACVCDPALIQYCYEGTTVLGFGELLIPDCAEDSAIFYDIEGNLLCNTDFQPLCEDVLPGELTDPQLLWHCFASSCNEVEDPIADLPWLSALVAAEDCCNQNRIYHYDNGVDSYFYVDPAYGVAGCDDALAPTVYDCEGNVVCLGGPGANCYGDLDLENYSGSLIYDCFSHGPILFENTPNLLAFAPVEGFTDLRTAVVVTSTANEQIEMQLEVSAEPNPSNGNFRILSDTQEEIQVAIWDIQGRSILQQIMIGGQLQLELQDVSPGIYLAQLSDGLSTKTIKLIIE